MAPRTRLNPVSIDFDKLEESVRKLGEKKDYELNNPKNLMTWYKAWSREVALWKDSRKVFYFENKWAAQTVIQAITTISAGYTVAVDAAQEFLGNFDWGEVPEDGLTISVEKGLSYVQGYLDCVLDSDRIEIGDKFARFSWSGGVQSSGSYSMSSIKFRFHRNPGEFRVVTLRIGAVKYPPFVGKSYTTSNPLSQRAKS